MKLTGTIAAIALAVTGTATLAEYPEKNIEVIISYGPGSNTDTGGRLFMNAMVAALGDSANYVPVNVAGAGGTIGTAQLAASPADGYTLGYNPIATLTIQPHLRPLPYGEDSFEPICKVTETPSAVMVDPNGPIQTMEELIEAARAGEVVGAGPAPGSLPFIAAMSAIKAYGIEDITYLPVGGGSNAAAAVLGGDATMSTDLYSAAANRGLKALAILADERRPDAPDVPTLKELGHDVQLSVWFGLVAPAGTPEDVLNTLSEACAVAVTDQAFIDGMAAARQVIDYQGREEFQAFYAQQFANNRQLLVDIGLIE
ncbi:MAG: tripartite tricarboxylate transporter substrate binding protein [Pseudomonadota bacterium]